MKNRLKALIDSLLENNSSFAAKVGIKPQTLNSYLNGSRTITNKFILKIKSAYPQINPDYLKQGKGEPLGNMDFKFDVTQVKDAEVQYLNQQLSLFKAENKILRERIELLENKN